MHHELDWGNPDLLALLDTVGWVGTDWPIALLEELRRDEAKLRRHRKKTLLALHPDKAPPEAAEEERRAITERFQLALQAFEDLDTFFSTGIVRPQKQRQNADAVSAAAKAADLMAQAAAAVGAVVAGQASDADASLIAAVELVDRAAPAMQALRDELQGIVAAQAAGQARKGAARTAGALHRRQASVGVPLDFDFLVNETDQVTEIRVRRRGAPPAQAEVLTRNGNLLSLHNTRPQHGYRGPSQAFAQALRRAALLCSEVPGGWLDWGPAGLRLADDGSSRSSFVFWQQLLAGNLPEAQLLEELAQVRQLCVRGRWAGQCTGCRGLPCA